MTETRAPCLVMKRNERLNREVSIRASLWGCPCLAWSNVLKSDGSSLAGCLSVCFSMLFCFLISPTCSAAPPQTSCNIIKRVRPWVFPGSFDFAISWIANDLLCFSIHRFDYLIGLIGGKCLKVKLNHLGHKYKSSIIQSSALKQRPYSILFQMNWGLNCSHMV